LAISLALSVAILLASLLALSLALSSSSRGITTYAIASKPGSEFFD
jgi:hypothetical protein